MTFIVRGQFKYIPCKRLEKTILLLEMYTPSYLVTFLLCAHYMPYANHEKAGQAGVCCVDTRDNI